MDRRRSMTTDGGRVSLIIRVGIDPFFWNKIEEEEKPIRENHFWEAGNLNLPTLKHHF